MEIETLEFSSTSEFDAWKSSIEMETTAKFIRHNRHQQKNTAFACHRSGKFDSRSTGKRSLKIMSLSKINGFCPATITSKVNENGEVSVNFLKTHIGHKPEMKHISLTTEERQNIAVKLAGKMPHDEILREIRRSVTNSHLRRIHLTTKKDILNIERSFNLLMRP